jgi:hypothetical protein
VGSSSIISGYRVEITGDPLWKAKKGSSNRDVLLARGEVGTGISSKSGNLSEAEAIVSASTVAFL